MIYHINTVFIVYSSKMSNFPAIMIGSVAAGSLFGPMTELINGFFQKRNKPVPAPKMSQEEIYRASIEEMARLHDERKQKPHTFTEESDIVNFIFMQVKTSINGLTAHFEVHIPLLKYECRTKPIGGTEMQHVANLPYLRNPTTFVNVSEHLKKVGITLKGIYSDEKNLGTMHTVIAICDILPAYTPLAN